MWNGRIDNGNHPASLRYHQVIELNDVSDLSESNNKSFSIIGFECDEGVKRNKGRIGASLAPNEIRKHLSKLPYHMDDAAKVIDVGNVVCEDGELERAQLQLGSYIHKLFNKRHIPIILGGGHETLYGHYLGVREFIGPDAKLGIINIDAHFDLRTEKVPSSGTMFKQILSEDNEAGYLCLGIQKFGNTEELFLEADKYDCQYILEEEIMEYNRTFSLIDEFSSQNDYVLLTLCMDSITSSAAPGVSAPSPFGLEPQTVRKLLRYIVAIDNVLSFDVSEVNPLLDKDEKTSKLSAHFLAEVMHHFT